MSSLGKRFGITGMVLLSGIVFDGASFYRQFPANQTIETFLEDPVSVLAAQGLSHEDFKKIPFRQNMFVLLFPILQKDAQI